MYPINFHAHSRWSDGSDTITVMAEASRYFGFSACILTDHIYSNPDCRFNMSLADYDAQCVEADKVAAAVGIPVVVGVELALMGLEELVIIGRDAIRHLIGVRDCNKAVTVADVRQARELYPCAVILCHPRNEERFMAQGGHLCIDAYEKLHARMPTFRQRQDPYERLGIVPVASSDAHAAGQLARCYSETAVPLTAEEDIVDYLRQRREVRLVVPDIRENPYRKQRVESTLVINFGDL